MKQLKYCIQEHSSKHLHYDLRLEFKGVARSWAIPKKPVLEEGTKRLAIQTEDHTVEYMDFEGEIKEGYGAGTVKMWDSGTWIAESVKENKVVGEIKGKKLKGRFVLLKIKEKSWLFFKLGKEVKK